MSENDKICLKEGESVFIHNSIGSVYGKVEKIDGRDVLIVADWCSLHPNPCIVDMQVGGDHYQQKIQPVEYIYANDIPFIEGNVIKYISRHKEKGGAADVEKAISYCAMLLKMEYGYTDDQIGKLLEKR